MPPPDNDLEEPVVRPLGHDDVAWSARLHLTALDQGFFPTLGSGFLRAYHRTFLTSPAAVALLVERGGRPCGFVVGTVDEIGHYRWVVRRHGPALATRASVSMLVRPTVLVTFVRTRLRRYLRGARRLVTRRSRSPLVATPASRRRATLTHIAVVEDERGNGLGGLLLDHFEAVVGGYGRDGLTVKTTDATPFYHSQGWTPVGESADLDGEVQTVLERTCRRLSA